MPLEQDSGVGVGVPAFCQNTCICTMLALVACVVPWGSMAVMDQDLIGSYSPSVVMRSGLAWDSYQIIYLAPLGIIFIYTYWY